MLVAPVRVLAISGSLRKASLNTALLEAVAELAPPNIQIKLYLGLAQLPLFNPDLVTPSPAAVDDLYHHIQAADALLIASPEYAHGISGVMKNALDWMVGNDSFVNKPVALFNASPRATLAQAALRETVATMSAIVIDDACITLPIAGHHHNRNDIAADTKIRSDIFDALEALSHIPAPPT